MEPNQTAALALVTLIGLIALIGLMIWSAARDCENGDYQ